MSFEQLTKGNYSGIISLVKEEIANNDVCLIQPIQRGKKYSLLLKRFDNTFEEITNLSKSAMERTKAKYQGAFTVNLAMIKQR